MGEQNTNTGLAQSAALRPGECLFPNTTGPRSPPASDEPLVCPHSPIFPILGRVDIRFDLDSATGQPHIFEHGMAEEKAAMKQNKFPAGWDEGRVESVLEHYEQQTEDDAVAEDEAAFRKRDQTVVLIPKRLVPEVTGLIEARQSRRQINQGRPSAASKPIAGRSRRSRT